jgi:hypothetical protein
MSIANIALFALVAAAAPPVPSEVWEAEIVLPAESSPVYVLQRDDHLNDVAEHFGVGWIDVIDAQGRTMPRGIVLALYAAGGAHRYIWFHDFGTPPYRVRVGAKSARRPEEIGDEDQRRLGVVGKHPDSVQLPLADLRNVRKMSEFAMPEAHLTPEEVQARGNDGLAMIVAALAALAVAALAAADHVLRRRIAALRGDNP